MFLLLWEKEEMNIWESVCIKEDCSQELGPSNQFFEQANEFFEQYFLTRRWMWIWPERERKESVHMGNT